jgi:hypothetical protein
MSSLSTTLRACQAADRICHKSQSGHAKKTGCKGRRKCWHFKRRLQLSHLCHWGTIMNDRQARFVRILPSIAFVFAFTCQAAAGYFPERPAGAKLRTFSGVLNDYGMGNDQGGFSLTAGSKESEFYIGWPMHINGKVVTCKDPENMGDTGPMGCTDWPSWLVERKTFVTARCCWTPTPTRG